MRRALGFLVAAGLLTVAGCGGSGAPSAPPRAASTTPSAPTPTPLPSGVATALPAAPTTQQATSRSAGEFSRYLLSLVMYSYQHRDMASVHHVAVTASCKGCRAGDAWVASERSRGIFQVPNRPAAVRHVVNVGSTKGVYDVVVEFDQSAGREVAGDGTVKDRLPKASNSHLEALLRWNPARRSWQVQNYSLNWGN